ncbi:zf-UBP-domain-containing protein [Neoconidiobolus thromboides FSU 785]|nr:zf-UBP-domain-containing protein [Neoconidiobolus thromboides FSU 785]
MHTIQFQLSTDYKQRIKSNILSHSSKSTLQKELPTLLETITNWKTIHPSLDIPDLPSFLNLPFNLYNKYFKLNLGGCYLFDFNLSHNITTSTTPNLSLSGINFSFSPEKSKTFITVKNYNLGSNTSFHLYKERSDILLNKLDTKEELLLGNDNDNLVSIVGIPKEYTLLKLLNFFDAYLASKELKKINLLISYKEDEMKLIFNLNFINFNTALEFYNHFNGQPFENNQSSYCFVLFTQFNLSLSTQSSQSSPKYHWELPMCINCLLRLDIQVTGLRDIPNNLNNIPEIQHNFHCKTCRIINQDLQLNEGCNTCGFQQDSWICMLCSHIGCGRYYQAHARKHFEDTKHTLALELKTNRIWDYISDKYQHRIDDKVDINESRKSKIDSVKMEEIQRLSEELYRQGIEFEKEISQLEKDCNELDIENQDIEMEYQLRVKEKNKTIQKKVKKEKKLIFKKKELEENINEQSLLLKNIIQNNLSIQKELKQAELNYNELKDQFQDLSFFLNSKLKIQNDLIEADNGTLILK